MREPVQIDPYQRATRGYLVKDMFPSIPGKCCCGCGKALEGRQRRWASAECGNRAFRLYEIRQGVAAAVREALLERDNAICAGCGVVVQQVRNTGVWGPPGDWSSGRLPYPCRKGRSCFGHKALVGEDHPYHYNRDRHRYALMDAIPWEGHHVVPVSEGGGGCDLDGYVIMCRACHGKETGALRKRLNGTPALEVDGVQEMMFSTPTGA